MSPCDDCPESTDGALGYTWCDTCPVRWQNGDEGDDES